MKKIMSYFSQFEKIFLLTSTILIITVNLLFGGKSLFETTSSIIGVTSVLLCAKGNPIGHGLGIIFSLMYGYIAFTFKYYGEMITYLGMTAPMGAYALISWLKNPYDGKISEVKIKKATKSELLLLIPLTAIVTLLFYFVLKYLGTSSLLISTFSVSTSFAAVYLCAKRSPLYALAYALNDVVLIILWIIASVSDTSYVSIVVCFLIFLVNDIYGYCNWLKMARNQSDN